MRTKNISKLHNDVVKKHLAEYSKWKFADTNKAIASVQIGQVRYSLDFKTMCQEALTLIGQNERKALKFEMLVEAMKQGRYDGLYHHLMKEDINEAYE